MRKDGDNGLALFFSRPEEPPSSLISSKGGICYLSPRCWASYLGPHSLNSSIVSMLRGLETKGQGGMDGWKVRGGPAQEDLSLLQVSGDIRVAWLNKMSHTKKRGLGNTEQMWLLALRLHQLRGYSPALGKACEAPSPLPRILRMA